MAGQPSENSGYRWVILGTVFMVQGVVNLSTYAFGPLAPFLRDDFGLTRAQVGIFSSLTYLAISTCAVPAGWLVDRFGIRRLLLLGPGAYGLLFALWAQMPTVLTAYLVVFLAGIGYVFVVPTTTMALVAWFPPRERATAISIKQSALTLGSAVTAVLSPSLSLLLGWRNTVAILGAASVLAAVSGYAVYRSKDDSRPAASRAPAISAFRQILANRGLILLGLVGLVYFGTQMSISTYLVLQLVEVRQLPVVAAGTFLMVTNLTAVFARVAWGAVSDRAFHGERRPVLLIIGLISGVIALVLSFSSEGMPGWLLYLSVGLLGITGFSWNGVFLTFATELSGRQLAATGFGWVVSLMSLGGLVGPPVFGYIVDRTSSYNPSWTIFGLLTMFAAVSVMLIKTPSKSSTGN
ncbi:MAG: MFS transporter [Chloroflexi bacterium]|nr:MFS transporter [Chloroflexota bacterium]